MHLDGTPYRNEEVPLSRAVLFGEEVNEEFIVRRDNHEDRFVLANAAPIVDKNNIIIAGIVVFLDITDKKKIEAEKVLLEAQARNNQKLEAIGTLASGVAHEINNPINGILNYAQIIRDSTEPESETNNFATEIIHETNRVSEIVKNLLDFSRQSGKQHSYAQIDDIIGKTLSLIRTIFKHDDIDLEVNISKNLSKVKCRSQQIQQVLMNLLTNARDSLNQKYPEYNANKKIKINCIQYEKDKRKWVSIEVLKIRELDWACPSATGLFKSIMAKLPLKPRKVNIRSLS
jgi:signal transduction histidine kinase